MSLAREAAFGKQASMELSALQFIHGMDKEAAAEDTIKLLKDIGSVGKEVGKAGLETAGKVVKKVGPKAMDLAEEGYERTRLALRNRKKRKAKEDKEQKTSKLRGALGGLALGAGALYLANKANQRDEVDNYYRVYG